jgi:exodeoxyribonuclease V gamma subunit
MQRWLQLELAREQGIAANLDFKLPASFVWQLITRVFPEVPRRSAFDPEVLAWRVLEALPRIDVLEGAALAANWKAADAAGRYELAWRVADVFDQYLIYRPDWLRFWESGKRLNLGPDEGWQAALWQELTRSGEPHRARLLGDLEQKLRQGLVPGLPSRLAVFGVSSLPPMIWRLLTALGEHIEINLFMLNPSQEYWGQLRRGDAGEGAHPLLASLGQQGRDFINTVAASGVNEPVKSQAFVAPQTGTVLAALQADLLTQNMRGEGERLAVSAGDDSVQVQVCHSALREVEVLHDQLLMQFEKHPDLMPDDVLVMCTDIQRYAPLIEAVFATRKSPAAIPYTIADRRLETEEPLLRHFADLLALPGSRFEVERVLALLEEPALRARFELSEADVPVIRRWCEQLHVRWGRDAVDREKRGLPTDVPMTWRDALARLQLGFALPVEMAASDDARFAGRAPADTVFSVGQAQVMARLSLLLETLLDWEDRLAYARPLHDWADTLDGLLEAFFAETTESRDALQYLRDVVLELRDQSRRASEAGVQPYAVIRRWLNRQVKGLESRRGFLHGAVTFCAMVPMRSLPFRMIAVLGMDDGAFPRQQKPWPFDLMADNPVAGDRSRRQDDRYLFLETLLAARDTLYLSHVGLSDVDGTVRPLSPVLAELMDQVRATVDMPDEKLFRQHFYTEHALQPFSPRYFLGHKKTDGTGLFSFSTRFAAASRLPGMRTQVACAAFGASLSSVPDDLLAITPQRFERFLSHPQRFFLRERMGVHIPYASEALSHEEPVDLTDQRALRQQLYRQEGLDVEGMRAEGLLPSGSWGAQLCMEQSGEIEKVRERVKALQATDIDPVRVHETIDGVTFAGALENVTSAGLVRVSLENRIYATDVLCLYFSHLLLCAARPEGVALCSHLIGLKDTIILPPVDNARQALAEFSAAYKDGLCWPLPLFRRASPAWLKKQNIDDARKAWEGNDYGVTGDGDDAWIKLLWRQADPLDERFMHWADRLYGTIKAEVAEIGK